MMWQVPPLVIAAQAFLFNIALGSSTSGTSRAIAAGVGLVVVLATLQRFARHRRIERTNSEWLEDREAKLGLPSVKARTKLKWWQQSYMVWNLTFWGLAVVDAAILVLAVLQLAGATAVLAAS